MARYHLFINHSIIPHPHNIRLQQLYCFQNRYPEDNSTNYQSMKNYKNEIVCTAHKQPVIKIDTISKKVFCAKCESETPEERKKRIEVLRAKLNALYLDELNKLKVQKIQIQKLTDLFLNHNMVDAKRKIKKQLPAIQKIVNDFIDREIQDANKILRAYIDKILKQWSSIDGRKFDLSYIEFEKAHPEIIQTIQTKKKQIKMAVSKKLKAELRVIFIKIFSL